MLPTPETPGLPSSVYPPSEDSYLLLDTLSSPSETAFLSSRFAVSSASSSASPPLLLAEIGTGSGIVLAFATAHARVLFGRPDVLALAVDLNGDACRAAGRTVALACASAASTATTTAATTPPSGLFLDAVQADLTGALRGGAVDVLVFNPPYVPTDSVPERPEDEDEDEDEGCHHENDDGDERARRIRLRDRAFQRESRLLDVAVAGGRDGMQVTERLLGQLDGVLGARGVAYVLFSVRNRPAEVAEGLRRRGWEVGVAGGTGRKGGIETLVVLRIARP